MKRHPRLRHVVGRAIRDLALWERGDRVAVAVSGGVDSVVLLDVLCATVGWHGARLSVVSVDHGVREGSARDLQFVEEICARRELPIHTARLSGLPPSEAALREARYAVFASLDVDRVALAHHRDDLAETLLIRMLRGTGSTGLAAMRPRRDRYVRPMLDIGRDEILAYAHAHSLPWVHDPTNDERVAMRNRLRLEGIPLLEEIRPGAARALARSARCAARDDDLLSAILDAHPDGRGPPWSAQFIAEGPEPLVRRALLRTVAGLGIEALDAIRDAASRGGGRIDTSQGQIHICDGQVSWLATTPR